MVAPCEVRIEADGIHVTPRGWHRLGALSRGFVIPLESVQTVEVRPASIQEEFRSVKPFARKVGSRIPGKYLAGSFRPWGRDIGSAWWLVKNPDKAVELSLRGFKYDRIIVEVDDPDGIAAQFRSLIGGENSA